jgi:hypothetical protein
MCNTCKAETARISLRKGEKNERLRHPAPVTFVEVIERLGHSPIYASGLVFRLNSTWGRADRHTSHDSNESGAFCFARRPPSDSLSGRGVPFDREAPCVLSRFRDGIGELHSEKMIQSQLRRLRRPRLMSRPDSFSCEAEYSEIEPDICYCLCRAWQPSADRVLQGSRIPALAPE